MKNVGIYGLELPVFLIAFFRGKLLGFLIKPLAYSVCCIYCLWSLSDFKG